LVQNKLIYTGASNKITLAINKDINKDKLKNVLDIFKNYNLIYDNELQEKLKLI
jgi:hypothetical protein